MEAMEAVEKTATESTVNEPGSKTIQGPAPHHDKPSKVHPELLPTKRTPTNMRSIALLAAFTTAVAGGSYWWLNRVPIEETEDSFVTGHIHQLGARVSGTVIAVPVQDNQHVKAGETLVKIDPKDFQNSLETAKAAAVKASWQALEAQTSIIKNTRAA